MQFDKLITACRAGGPGPATARYMSSTAGNVRTTRPRRTSAPCRASDDAQPPATSTVVALELKSDPGAGGRLRRPGPSSLACCWWRLASAASPEQVRAGADRESIGDAGTRSGVTESTTASLRGGMWGTPDASQTPPSRVPRLCRDRSGVHKANAPGAQLSIGERLVRGARDRAR